MKETNWLKEFEAIKGKRFKSFKFPYEASEYNKMQDEYIEFLVDKIEEFKRLVDEKTN